MNKKELVKLYIYNDVENWEWSYNDFVDFLVSEYNYKDINYLISEPFNKKEFANMVKKELKKYVSLEQIANDKMNDFIKEKTKIKIRKC